MEMFHEATRAWFTREVGEPTEAQRMAWPAIARDESTLICAPTGAGKTLAAFLWCIDRLTRLAREGRLEPRAYVLYISPLKALGNDVRVNLERPLNGIQALSPGAGEVRVGVRNGDTLPAERQRQLRRPPHIWITTPESLYILLSSQAGRRALCTVEAVVVDELHAILDSKRGAHLFFSLERLDALCGRRVPRIGLSATLADPQQAAACLTGCTDGTPRPVFTAVCNMKKPAQMQVRLPVEDLRALPEGSIWPELLRALYQATQSAHTTLVFCEGRAICERVAHGLNQLAGGETPYALTHHGCVSRAQRLEAEQKLKRGALRVLCATSSMELGIDVGEIDLVVQVGAPASISGALQRLGRSGHAPGRTSRMWFYPRTADELLLDGFTARGAREGRIERARPPRLCLDVLAQQLVSMAAVGEYGVEDALALARGAYNFKELTREQLESVLRMLAGDYEHEEDRPARPRLLYDRIHGRVSGDGYTRLLALRAGGTIPDRGLYSVVLEDGTRLGELDEEFVFEARLGDRFVLGAFCWQIARIAHDRVVVRPSGAGGAQSPFWRGDGAGRPFETGRLFGSYLRELEQAEHAGRLERALGEMGLDECGVRNAARRLRDQWQALGALATDQLILLEHFSDPAGERQLLVHSVFGRRVNLPLGLLLQDAARRLTGADVRLHVSDDGLLLHLTGGAALPDGLMGALDARSAREEVARLLPGSPLFGMAFRYNAVRAMMMGVRGGGRIPLWVQRLRGAEALARAAAHPEHPLLRETLRECLEDYADMDALTGLLEEIALGRVGVLERRSATPSPMALALRRALEAVEMYDYDPTPSVAAQLKIPSLDPEEEAVRTAAAPVCAPDSPERLHALFMEQGDAEAGEIQVPGEWLEQLVTQGRVRYIDPGLWICEEQAELYRAALEQGDEAALLRVMRRCLRFHGPLRTEDIAGRYQLETERAHGLLRTLAAEGAAIQHGDVWLHADVYRRAQRLTIAGRRSSVTTQPPEHYAALLCTLLRAQGSPAEQLRDGLERLYGLALPLEHWEGVALPLRTQGYRPALLDGLLASGEAVWRLHPGERTLLSFHPAGAVDYDTDPEPDWAVLSLTETERWMLRLLKTRGASFASALSARIPGAPGILRDLAHRGLVCCDGFAPLREAPAGSAKQRARALASQASGGRWELAWPLAARTLDEQLQAAFARWGVLSREAAKREGIPWAAALERLRVMEYAGEARRGYFVRGLSGAQFVRECDFARVTALLSRPEQACFTLCAADPAQPWGTLLKQPLDAAFLCVPGTVITLCAGRVALIAERQGESVRLPVPEAAPAALVDFARAFALGRVYPRLSALTVRQYSPDAAPLLEAAGFTREMRDYVLWR